MTEWRQRYACPSWCTTSARDHAEDDPGRPLHTAPMPVSDFLAGQTGDGTLTAYFAQREGEMTSQRLRELANECVAAAEWLEQQGGER